RSCGRSSRRPVSGCASTTRIKVRDTSSDEADGARVKVGVPTEVKADEYRVALTPAGVRELTDAGHEAFVQRGAGDGSGIGDEAYAAQGASIVPDADELFG